MNDVPNLSKRIYSRKTVFLRNSKIPIIFACIIDCSRAQVTSPHLTRDFAFSFIRLWRQEMQGLRSRHSAEGRQSRRRGRLQSGHQGRGRGRAEGHSQRPRRLRGAVPSQPSQRDHLRVRIQSPCRGTARGPRHLRRSTHTEECFQGGSMRCNT